MPQDLISILNKIYTIAVVKGYYISLKRYHIVLGDISYCIQSKHSFFFKSTSLKLNFEILGFIFQKQSRQNYLCAKSFIFKVASEYIFISYTIVINGNQRGKHHFNI